MKRCRLCYGANYSNCEDDFSCIVREFSKIIFLFFGFYKAHVSNLPNAAFVVKYNRSGGVFAVPFLPGLAAQTGLARLETSPEKQRKYADFIDRKIRSLED